jgi:iron-sulfur cluster repair protein YtfE (RIC family)
MGGVCWAFLDLPPHRLQTGRHEIAPADILEHTKDVLKACKIMKMMQRACKKHATGMQKGMQRECKRHANASKNMRTHTNACKRKQKACKGYVKAYSKHTKGMQKAS